MSHKDQILYEAHALYHMGYDQGYEEAREAAHPDWAKTRHEKYPFITHNDMINLPEILRLGYSHGFIDGETENTLEILQRSE